MKWLRDLARDQPCQIRVPGFCTHRSDQVVLCHVRSAELPFFDGAKVHDFLGAHGCMACHMVIDGQLRTQFTKDERDLMLLQGVMRTQAALLKRRAIVITKGEGESQ